MAFKFIKTTAMCLLAASMISASAQAATVGGGTVNATALNLRSDKNIEASSKMLIPDGAFLLVEEKSGDWYKVMYNGASGYVHSGYISFSETLNGNYAVKGTVTGSSVRLRSAANANSTVITYLNIGDALSITGVSGQWLKVCTAGGTEGYISSDYLNCLSATFSADTIGFSIGQQVVATAKEYLGYGYVWGGMSTSGFDCSGFVNYIYKLYGYSMNRTAQNIYSNDGSYVEKDKLQAGDLVFFGYSASSVSHVGMYIGNGQFIHASSSAGMVVITDLSASYYTRMYVGAKRIA